MVGTVIGAGFVSGRELLQFFGCFRISAIYCAGLLFFLCYLLFMRLGSVFGGFEETLKGVFGRFARFVKTIVLFGSLVSSVGMLSGINSLLPLAKPFLSLAFLAGVCFVCEKGVKGIGLVNLIVMPVLLVAVSFLIFSRRALSPSEPPRAGFASVLSVLLYVSMNTFLSMPVLCDLGAELKNRAALLCALSALIISSAIGLILSAVCSDKSSYSYDLPLLYILDGVKIFSLLACGGMLTTLLSSFYPLYTLAGRRWGKAGKLALFAAAECCSFIGFKSLIASVYPALGVFGAAITAIAAVRYAGKTTFKERLTEALPRPRSGGPRKRRTKISVKQMKDFN